MADDSLAVISSSFLYRVAYTIYNNLQFKSKPLVGLIDSLIAFSVVSRSPFLKWILLNFYNIEHNILHKHLPFLHVSKLFLYSMKLCQQTAHYCKKTSSLSFILAVFWNSFSVDIFISNMCVYIYCYRTVLCLIKLKFALNLQAQKATRMSGRKLQFIFFKWVLKCETLPKTSDY